ncbi:hypothetical protein SAMN05216223_12763 [Actinacidiphila yanglinensis]|uniref:Uncharacterized protein n=1 Tax=Actinacidiphila yanglinensis TaxID=310779 RepID=A0A1H6E8H1_9ACTN|nr:hypothetical protein [Actinacidiphila yanglinensis]SEG93236.1 hypothetical protein SAMN05216223_12763 [Actinacidiphila yanglinensis]
MHSWHALTIAEQTLMRRALAGHALAGVVQDYGDALRWAGRADAPPLRSFTEREQRALVPHLAGVAVDLAERGLPTVEVRQSHGAGASALVAGPELREVLTDPAHWLWTPRPSRNVGLTAPQPVRERWFGAGYPTADTSALPTWEELSIGRREVLVCAAEASGMLTGAFGIWADPPDDLGAIARRAWVDRQLAPLSSFVREGWIEVRHHPDEARDAFTVIPFEGLRAALTDPAVRYQGEDWGVGVGCVFTHAGLAVWRGGWGDAWGRRLTLS